MMQWFIFTGLIFRLLNVAIKEDVLDLWPKADRNFTESQRNSKQKDGGKKKLYRRPCLFLRFQITNSYQLNNDLTQSTSDYPFTPHTMGCLTMPLSQRDPPTATCPHRCHGHARPKTSRHVTVVAHKLDWKCPEEV